MFFFWGWYTIGWIKTCAICLFLFLLCRGYLFWFLLYRVCNIAIRIAQLVWSQDWVDAAVGLKGLPPPPFFFEEKGGRRNQSLLNPFLDPPLIQNHLSYTRWRHHHIGLGLPAALVAIVHASSSEVWTTKALGGRAAVFRYPLNRYLHPL